MGLFDIFGKADTPDKIQEKILKLEKEKARKLSNPNCSKDDLVPYDIKIQNLKELYKELTGKEFNI